MDGAVLGVRRDLVTNQLLGVRRDLVTNQFNWCMKLSILGAYGIHLCCVGLL